MTLRSRFITRWNRHATRKLHSLLPRYTTHVLCEVFSFLSHKSCKSQCFLIKSNQSRDNVTEFSSYDFRWTSCSICGGLDTLFHSSACNLYSGYCYITFIIYITFWNEYIFLTRTPSFSPKVLYFFNQTPQLACFARLLFEGGVYFFWKPADINNSWIRYVWAI